MDKNKINDKDFVNSKKAKTSAFSADFSDKTIIRKYILYKQN